MIKRTQAIRQQQPIIILSVFDHFVGLPLKGLTFHQNCRIKNYYSRRDYDYGFRKIPLEIDSYHRETNGLLINGLVSIG